MALQMQHSLAGDVAKFGCFDRVQRVLAGTKPVQPIIAGGVACVNCRALVPVPAVDFDIVCHVDAIASISAMRMSSLNAAPAQSTVPRASTIAEEPNETRSAVRPAT